MPHSYSAQQVSVSFYELNRPTLKTTAVDHSHRSTHKQVICGAAERDEAETVKVTVQWRSSGGTFGSSLKLKVLRSAHCRGLGCVPNTEDGSPCSCAVVSESGSELNSLTSSCLSPIMPLPPTTLPQDILSARAITSPDFKADTVSEMLAILYVHIWLYTSTGKFIPGVGNLSDV